MDDNTHSEAGKAAQVQCGARVNLTLARYAGERLTVLGLRLGVVESATGGLISQLITSVPGCSRYYLGGITAYDNRIKTSLLGVTSETLASYGAVSSRVAEEMAAGGLRLLGADICLSDTGLAGPGGASPEKPLGLFYLGLADTHRVFSRRFVFQGTRQQTRHQAAAEALKWLLEHLATSEQG